MSDENEAKHCSNCKQDIAAANFVMHEVHCRRNIVLCPKCREPCPRSKLEEHDEEEHKLIPCGMCSESFEPKDLDLHTENCPRRPSQCAYCEIECPRDELDQHMNYCGTRTEQCHKCEQFIMHKDLVKHEDSNCNYPESKQQNDVAASNGTRLTRPAANSDDVIVNGRYGLGDFRNSFVRGELERFMNDPESSGSRTNQSQQRNAASTTTTFRNNFGNRDNGYLSRSRATNVVQKRNPILPKNTNQRGNRTSGVGRGLANAGSQGPGSRNLVNRDEQLHSSGFSDGLNNQGDMDDLLAMQLSNDFNFNLEDIDDHMIAEDRARTTNVNNIYPPVQGVQDTVSNQRSSIDEAMIPCEYCGDAFPLSTLLQHQTNCDTLQGATSNGSQNNFVGTSHNNSQPTTVEVNSRSDVLNNANSSAASAASENGRGQLDIIDNLAQVQDMEWATSAGDHMYDYSEALFPCEFCGETFPEDIFIQHQSVCDDNPYKTPRVMTPKVRNTATTASNVAAAGTSYDRLSSQPRNASISNTYARYGASRVTNNTASESRLPDSRRTPEARRMGTVNKTRSTLDEFMHNPSYAPVQLPSNDSRSRYSGSSDAVGAIGGGSGGGRHIGVKSPSNSTLPGSSVRSPFSQISSIAPSNRNTQGEQERYTPSGIVKVTQKQPNKPRPVARTTFDSTAIGDVGRVARPTPANPTDNARANRTKVKRPPRDV